MEELPAWVTEAVEIVPSDPEWPLAAERLGHEVQRRLAPWLCSEVEHVGSTAVPGLAAKPIIDLQALVASFDVAALVESALTPHDWFLVPPELDRRPWRRFLIHVRDGHRHAHLHLMQPGAARWEQQRQFRDALRGDPTLAARYADLKRQLVAAGIDRERYSDAKTDFVRSVVAAVTRSEVAAGGPTRRRRSDAGWRHR